MAAEKRAKKMIPEMLPKMEWLEESLVPSYLNISLEHFKRNTEDQPLKISSFFGKRYYNVKQINELIEQSLMIEPIVYKKN